MNTHKLEKYLTAARRDVSSMIDKISSSVHAEAYDSIDDLLIHFKEDVDRHFDSLEIELKHLKAKRHTQIEDTVRELKEQIQALQKANKTAASNNFLLEYKKKDLMLLADNLEEAYEEISRKNDKLEKQKKKILEQSKKLKEAHEEILSKNRELQIQKESILDQAEYLHEANQTISKIHAEVRKQKDEILKKNEELVLLNNEKNNLLSIVAHDLKSPLNQIQGVINVIKVTSRELTEDTLKYLLIIENSVNRLNEMIGRILNVEAIESQKLNLSLENCDLSQLALDCLDRYEITADAKNIEIDRRIELEVIAFVDPGFINQIYENLLSNAIKFSPSGTTITVNLYKKQEQAIFRITDEGPGISKEDQGKLFGRFQKLTARPTGNETSTGLGLSIVKQFVEAMKGNIHCESVPGKGTTFEVSFPAV